MITALTDKQAQLSEFRANMFNKSLTMFEWSNLPDTIPAVELEKLLQINGYAIIAKVDGNLYAFTGGFSGQDVYKRPTKAIVNNPALNNHDEFTIGEDCVVIKNDDMQQGLTKLYNHYGQRLIENQITMLMTDYNYRIPFTISSNDDATTQSAREYLQKIVDGSLGVIGEARLFKSLSVTPTNNKGTNDFADLYGYQQFILAQLNNAIGLATNNNMKRERITTNEIEINKNASYPLVDNMLANRQNAVDAINKMFDLEIEVKFSSIWGSENNSNDKSVGGGDEQPEEKSEQPEPGSEPTNETQPETQPDNRKTEKLNDENSNNNEDVDSEQPKNNEQPTGDDDNQSVNADVDDKDDKKKGDQK